MRPVLLIVTILPLVTAPAAARDAIEAACRQIQKACVTKRDGSHLPRLAALRQLGDPTLGMLFVRLLEHPEWQVQVHAMLGLGELHDPPQIDAALVLTIETAAQEAIVANAIDLDLITATQMQSLVQAEGLTPMPRLLLLGELLLQEMPVDETVMRDLAADPELRLSALASCLLARLGDTGPLVTYANQLSGLSQPERTQYLLLVLEMIRQYEVGRAADWIARLLEEDGLHQEVIYRAIYSLLTLDAPRGLELWRRQLGPEPSHRDSVRYGLLLLASKVQAPPANYDQLNTDDDLVRTMVALGQATDSEDLAAAYIELFELEHRRTTEWAATVLDTLEPEAAQRICLHLIDRVDDTQRVRPSHTALAIKAVSVLAHIDPDAVQARLDGAADDSLLQQAILLGLFEIDDLMAGRAAASVSRIGFGRSDSLALILLAKHRPDLTLADLETLGMIASGGGLVSDALQTQAGWLYLKHADALEPAMDLIFVDP